MESYTLTVEAWTLTVEAYNVTVEAETLAVEAPHQLSVIHESVQLFMAGAVSLISRKVNLLIPSLTQFVQFPSRKQLLTENEFRGSFAEAFFPDHPMARSIYIYM